MRVKVVGEVSINNQAVKLAGHGIYDPKTRAYQFDQLTPGNLTIGGKDLLLVSFLPRVALAFTASKGSQSLLDQSQEGIHVKFTARRKVDNVNAIDAAVFAKRDKDTLTLQCNGRVNATADRVIEKDGEAVVRLGVNPVDGTFSGGVRINYDIATDDPASLGTADFWNISGSFEGVRAGADSAYAHVDHCGGNLATGTLKGLVSRLPASTLILPGILTFSGVARKDGAIHQFLGISDQTGAGRTLVTFPVKVRRGMTASEVATAVEEGFGRAKELNPEMRYIIAVQGGDGVRITKPDRSSARVAVAMTLDGRKIATAKEAANNPLNRVVAVQSFSDQGVLAAENTGIRNQFGVLGNPELTGWLTPFKIIFNTDNPRVGNLATGGQVHVLLNWSETVEGVERRESTTSFSDLIVRTNRGETAEQVMIRVAQQLRARRSQWGSYPFIQRSGNVLYIDAGIEFPHIVSLASTDEGVGYMSAAADLPFFKK